MVLYFIFGTFLIFGERFEGYTEDNFKLGLPFLRGQNGDCEVIIISPSETEAKSIPAIVTR